jgi:hypothetical protein
MSDLLAMIAKLENSANTFALEYLAFEEADPEGAGLLQLIVKDNRPLGFDFTNDRSPTLLGREELAICTVMAQPSARASCLAGRWRDASRRFNVLAVSGGTEKPARAAICQSRLLASWSISGLTQHQRSRRVDAVPHSVGGFNLENALRNGAELYDQFGSSPETACCNRSSWPPL